MDKVSLFAITFFLVFIQDGLYGQNASNIKKGKLLYQNGLSSQKEVKDWVMEGPGEVSFENGWMHMYAPNQEYHHVFWCPKDFPDSIIIEWEAQNMATDSGLCIIFFSAKGLKGEDIFDPSLPQRDGTFSQYTKGRLRSYHISYYANTPNKPDRGDAHLRKNDDFRLVYTGPEGIPSTSTAVHQLKLIKYGPLIQMYVDDRKVIDWIDIEENDPRPYYKDGKIGFRQMQWTHFRYRNFRVYKIAD